MIHIHLSLMPPPLSSLTANKAKVGRVSSERARGWRNAMGWELKTQRPKPIRGQVDVRVSMGPPRKGADIDNRLKALLDLLVEHKLIEDDSWPIVRSVSAEWSEGVKGCVVAVFPVAGAVNLEAAE